jgi:hypothetical protein
LDDVPVSSIRDILSVILAYVSIILKGEAWSVQNPGSGVVAASAAPHAVAPAVAAAAATAMRRGIQMTSSPRSEESLVGGTGIRMDDFPFIFGMGTTCHDRRKLSGSRNIRLMD